MPKLANVKYVCVKAAACLNALKRHLLRASLYCKKLVARFEAWRCLPGLTQIRSSLSEGFARMVIMQRGRQLGQRRTASVEVDSCFERSGQRTDTGVLIEVEVGKRRIRIRGLYGERAEAFLRECLK